MSTISRLFIQILFLCIAHAGYAQHVHHPTPAQNELQIGDKGFRHMEFHEIYQLKTVFGGHCKCNVGSGECRPTKIRRTLLGSPRGYDILINRQYHPIPANTYEPNGQEIPQEIFNKLNEYEAHACSYPTTEGIVIPCVMLNITDG